MREAEPAGPPPGVLRVRSEHQPADPPSQGDVPAPGTRAVCQVRPADEARRAARTADGHGLYRHARGVGSTLARAEIEAERAPGREGCDRKVRRLGGPAREVSEEKRPRVLEIAGPPAASPRRWGGGTLP